MDDCRRILHEVVSAPALQWSSENRHGRRVLLAIHYDTVYPIDHPSNRVNELETINC